MFPVEAEQAVEQTVELQMTWAAMALRWRHFNVKIGSDNGCVSSGVTHQAMAQSHVDPDIWCYLSPPGTPLTNMD